MTLLDAFAVVSLLRNEPAGVQVAALLKTRETGAIAVNLAEAADVLMRRNGLSLERVRPMIEQRLGESVALVPFDERDAVVAGALRAAHYHRSRSALSIADCMLLAAARRGGYAVATADEPLLAAANREGIGTHALDRAGLRAPLS